MSKIHVKCDFGTKNLFDMDFNGTKGTTSENLREAKAKIMIQINKHMDVNSNDIGEDVDLLEEGEPADDADPLLKGPDDSGKGKKRKGGPRGGDQRHKMAQHTQPAV